MKSIYNETKSERQGTPQIERVVDNTRIELHPNYLHFVNSTILGRISELYKYLKNSGLNIDRYYTSSKHVIQRQRKSYSHHKLQNEIFNWVKNTLFPRLIRHKLSLEITGDTLRTCYHKDLITLPMLIL